MQINKQLQVIMVWFHGVHFKIATIIVYAQLIHHALLFLYLFLQILHPATKLAHIKVNSQNKGKNGLGRIWEEFCLNKCY